MSRSKHKSEPSGTVEPGSTVIVRARGYPAWPAVVLYEDDVPEHVARVKPRRKEVIPVLFYVDNSFLWISPSEAKILPASEAAKAAKVPKTKRTLREAYEMATASPPYSEVVNSALGIAPSSEAEESSAAEPEPEPKPSRRARSAAQRAAEALLPKPRAPGGGRKRSSEPPAAPTGGAASKGGRKKQKVAPEEPKDEPKEEPEEDSEEYMDNGTTEDTEFSTGETDAQHEEDLEKSQAARLALCSMVRQVVQEMLLSEQPEEVDESKLDGAVKQLEDAPEIEISVVRRSKLTRVVAAVVALPVVPDLLRPRLEALLDKWNTPAEPIIRGIPEDLVPQEELDAEDFDTSTREPSEAPEMQRNLDQEDAEGSNSVGNPDVATEAPGTGSPVQGTSTQTTPAPESTSGTVEPAAASSLAADEEKPAPESQSRTN